MMYNLIDLLLCFFIYAFLGWCIEVCFIAVTTGKFVNRGFLNGPVCPVYGFGVLLVTNILMPYKSNVFVLFAGAVLLTSALELSTGIILEKLFNQRWWDYFDYPFNLNGYICPLMSIVWGVACLNTVYIFHPLITGVVGIIPLYIAKIILILFIFCLIIDMSATVSAIVNLQRRLEKIDKIAILLRNYSDDMGKNLADRAIEVAEMTSDLKDEMSDALEVRKQSFDDKIKARAEKFRENTQNGKSTAEQLRVSSHELLSSLSVIQRRLIKAFPGAKSKKFDSALQELKKFFKD